MKTYDAIIVGASEAGVTLAEDLSWQGLRVALVERTALGGASFNYGEVPLGVFAASAHYFHELIDHKDDVLAGVTPVVDVPAIVRKANKLMQDSIANLTLRVGDLPSCDLVIGQVQFTGDHTLSVAGEILTAPRIFLNPGTRPAVPTIEGLASSGFLTNESLLRLEKVPEHLIIVGGGYEGVEIAQTFKRLGARVTLLEKTARILWGEDEDISIAVTNTLVGDGCAVFTRSDVVAIERQHHVVKVRYLVDGEHKEVEGTDILVATGRVPDTDEIGLGLTRLALDIKGYVIVDDELRASVDGVWAIGDCNGRGGYPGAVVDDLFVILANVLQGGNLKAVNRIPVYSFRFEPSFARVGATEGEARARRTNVSTEILPTMRGGYGDWQGQGCFTKLIADPSRNLLLGYTIFSPGAAEAVEVAVEMMKQGIPVFALGSDGQPDLGQLAKTKRQLN